MAGIKILKMLPDLKENIDLLDMIDNINLVTSSNVKDHDDLIRIETQEKIKTILKNKIRNLKSTLEIKE